MRYSFATAYPQQGQYYRACIGCGRGFLEPSYDSPTFTATNPPTCSDCQAKAKTDRNPSDSE